MNLFTGLETAKRSILARQAALQTIQHNIANASTPGYSRQRVELRASAPYHAPTRMHNVDSGQFGTGVEVNQVFRVRNTVLDYNLREQLEILGNFEKQYAFFSEVQRVFGDLGDYDLQTVLDQFWSALQRLTTNPENHAIRAELVQQGQSLSQRFNVLAKDLIRLRTEADREIEAVVSQVNGLLEQLADVNRQIMRVQAGGKNPNDLLDQRDLILDQLAYLIDIEVSTYDKIHFSLTVGGRTLVQDGLAYPLTLEKNGDGFFEIRTRDGQAFSVRDGVLEGLLVSRDQNITAFLDKVNELAASIITHINAVHRVGFGLDNSTGLDLFIGNDASTMQFNPLLASHPEKIAASDQPHTAGSGKIAQEMADLFKKPLIDGTTWNNYYEMLVADLGVVARRSKAALDNQQLIVSSLKEMRLSESGVSLDEEMVEMLQYQHGYNASAKMISVYDGMLNTILNLRA